jgi:hypothetical protein
VADRQAPATDGLDARARRRLDRFADGFERVNAHDYVRYATVPPDPDATARAEADVVRLIGTGRRHDAIRAAIEAFVEAAGIAYSNHLALPQYLLLNDAVADQPDDRRRFLRALERAVAAIVLWDELTDDDRDLLAGPWLDLVDRAVQA